ncbi:MAG TPA: PfkB family carbohydrate kinase [Bacillota bacterium]|nr:PfkB family carbohydrate kinase [Bacillota bacterium]
MKHDLLAIGGAYVDINVPNFPLPEAGLALETETVGQAYRLEPGGSAVNFARLCAALQISTAFIGKAGNDEMGRILSELLTQAGVDPALMFSDKVSTNVSFNMVNSAGKSIMAVAGTANQALAADEVYTQASQRLATSAYLFLGGCFKLKSLMSAFVRLAQDAKAAGTKVVLDHARLNSGVTEAEKQAVRELALLADYYLPSAGEFMELWDAPSIEAGLHALSGRTSGVIVVKNSDKGVVAWLDGTIVTVPAFAVTPLHTIGAGDSFDAGFIAALHKGQTPLASIRFGCATAALKISQEALPTHAQVADFLTQQPEGLAHLRDSISGHMLA